MIKKENIINSYDLHRILNSEKISIINFVNLHSYVMLFYDSQFKESIDISHLAIDGRQLERDLASKGLFVERLTGYKATLIAFEDLNGRNSRCSVAVLGGTISQSQKFLKRVKEKYKNINFDMYPAFKISDSGNILKEDTHYLTKLQSQKYDLVLVCFGAPKQEKFVKNYLNVLNTSNIMCVGAVIDYIANNNYPNFISRLGLEWLYRLVTQPRRIWRRVFISGFLYFTFFRAKL
jgi:N-acetylglucosaminyldiphosphoundecaprenol N-acetyl-beta-D-mannosaminyltransferase